MTEHLGYERNEPGPGVHARHGTRSTIVATGFGPVDIEVPEGRDAWFDPTVVRKRQRRLNGIDEIVVSWTPPGA